MMLTGVSPGASICAWDKLSIDPGTIGPTTLALIPAFPKEDVTIMVPLPIVVQETKTWPTGVPCGVQLSPVAWIMPPVTQMLIKEVESQFPVIRY